MHPEVFRAFDEICRDLAIDGDAIEIGASPHHQTLLVLPSLRRASRRLGIGLDGEAEGEGYSIRRHDAHDLSHLGDGTFRFVLSNSMLEHDGHFWLSLAEARRILAPGGYLVLGVPGFSRMGNLPGGRFFKWLSRLPAIGQTWREASAALEVSSLTLGRHGYPGDYYRFSEQAMIDVLLEGMEQIHTRLILSPPRVIGWGRKPAGPALSR
jgi:SAM-dependent methyltransferase